MVKAAMDGPVLMAKNEPIVSSTLVLLIYVVVFIGIIHFNGWKLNKTVSYSFFVAHLVFVGYSLLTCLQPPIIKMPF